MYLLDPSTDCWHNATHNPVNIENKVQAEVSVSVWIWFRQRNAWEPFY